MQPMITSDANETLTNCRPVRTIAMLPPLLTIADAGINLVINGCWVWADLALHQGDRLALVGQNGAGNQPHETACRTGRWMKAACGVPGAANPIFHRHRKFPQVRAFATSLPRKPTALQPATRLIQPLMQLGLDPHRSSDGLSGGEARRHWRAHFTQKPDILLLTNRQTIWICQQSNGWRGQAGTASWGAVDYQP